MLGANILQDMGLTKNEAAIFHVLMENGDLSATEIAKKTGLNRPYVYYAVDRLREKGFLSEAIIEGVKHYRLLPAEDIVLFEQQKVALFKEYMQEVMQKQSKEETCVELLKGRFVIKTLIRRAMKEAVRGDEILYVGIDESIMEEIEPVYLRKALLHFEKNGVTERMLVKEGGKVLEYAKTTSYRFLKPDLIEGTAKIIYGGTTIHLIYGTPTHAIVIKNAKLANTEKKQFELFWEKSKLL